VLPAPHTHTHTHTHTVTNTRARTHARAQNMDACPVSRCTKRLHGKRGWAHQTAETPPCSAHHKSGKSPCDTTGTPSSALVRRVELRSSCKRSVGRRVSLRSGGSAQAAAPRRPARLRERPTVQVRDALDYEDGWPLRCRPRRSRVLFARSRRSSLGMAARTGLLWPLAAPPSGMRPVFLRLLAAVLQDRPGLPCGR